MNKTTASVVRAGLDSRVASLNAIRPAAAKPSHGWLRAVRQSLGLGQAQVAKRLNLARQTYAQFEESEARSAITLESLQRAAEAMECELLYFVVPRESIAHSFTELAHRNDPEFRHLQASEHSMVLEGQAVGDLRRNQSARNEH